jgi:predicted dehydrogenase
VTVRLAVIGVGDVARRDYLPELHRLTGRAEVTVACARRAVRAEEAAAAFGIPRWTTSYEEALASDDVDAILNLTPFSLHTEITLAALRAGKHVYSEKPLAATSAEAGTIAEAAARAGLVVVAAPCVLVFPQVQRAREILADGALGAVHTARGHGLGGVPPWSGFVSDPSPYFAAGSGPLVDMAVYPLHALTGLLGPVRRVTALSRRTRDSFEILEGPLSRTRVPVLVDDNWHLALELDGGVLATVEANNCADAALAPELELRGERGALGVSLLDVAAPVQLVADGESRDEPVPHERAEGPDHILGVAHLVDCIESGTEPVLGIAHARHVIDVIEAARLSAGEARTVDVSSDFPRTRARARQGSGRAG